MEERLNDEQVRVQRKRHVDLEFRGENRAWGEALLREATTEAFPELVEDLDFSSGHIINP